jgi:putative flippase GtrA
LRQFIRFGVVGVIQNGLNIGVYAACVAAGVPFLVAFVVAAAVSLVMAFLLNRRWTFAVSSDRSAERAIRFVAIWIAIVLLALPLLAVLVDVAGVPKVPAQVIVVAIGAPVSFLAQRRWTFAASTPRLR